MKKILLSVLTFFSLTALAQQEDSQEAKNPIGIGIRLGDFNGLSAQYFLVDAKMSFSLDVGRSYFFGDNYEKRFELYAEDQGIVYQNYDRKETNEGPSYGFKFNICKYGNIGNTPHFYWYGGIGFQVRRFSLDHGYQVEKTAANSSQVRYDDVVIDDVKHSSVGLDFILGSEYVFQDFPMSVFVDISMFMEANELSGHLMGQMGLGGRFHF